VVDLRRVRQNTDAIVRATGVPVIAVVKADAYGLGASRVAAVIGDLLEGFFVFDAAEAIEARLFEITGKRTIALHGSSNDPADYIPRRIHPAVWTIERASALRAARPALSVDTGQQRFACGWKLIGNVLAAGDCQEVFTHATNIAQVQAFCDLMDNHDRAHSKGNFFMHAAGSSLLHEPAARLRAVRPGLALYRGAVRVSTALVETRESAGPAGYSGFTTPNHGIIICGYSNGLKAGPCLVNGRPSRILEVGMQSAFVETQPGDKPGDEVVLLGDSLTEQQIAPAWNTSPHECLVRLTGSGQRAYLE
jgi:alanine racemase